MTFEYIFNNLYSSLYKYFYYKLVDKSEIDDLIQESFSIFYNKYYKKDITIESSQKLLYAICNNVYKQWITKLSKRKEHLTYSSKVLEFSFEDFTDNEYENKLDKYKEELKQKIEKLNPMIKQVLILRFYEGKSREEIAKILNISESDVHTYQKRGVKYLKKSFGVKTVPLLGLLM